MRALGREVTLRRAERDAALVIAVLRRAGYGDATIRAATHALRVTHACERRTMHRFDYGHAHEPAAWVSRASRERIASTVSDAQLATHRDSADAARVRHREPCALVRDRGCGVSVG